MFKSFLSLILATALLSLPVISAAGQRDDAVASVKVFKEIRGLQYVYTYEVTNRGTVPIIGFSVGFDYYRGDSQFSGDHPQLIKSPQLWEGNVITLESSDRYEIAWDITSQPGAIAGNQSVTGFQIISDRDYSLFSNANWTVIISGAPTRASSRLQLVQGPPPDTVPPYISVTLSPNVIWPPNKRMVPITATVIASDNKDATPTIRLISIECNDCDSAVNDIANATFGTDDRQFMLRADRIGHSKTGRVYTITYSATDSAGNVGTGTATVTVPHDRRK